MRQTPRIVFRDKLSNGISILCIDDSFLEHDIVVKINNYGSFLDTEVGIIGFQHLLEHCISHKHEDNNIISNATTGFNYMTIDINVKHGFEESIRYLKEWFFKNGNMDRIDFSRSLSLEDIKRYVNLLENEYLFRESLDLHWSQELFFISDQEYYYYGGNEKTFSGKEKDIQKALASPFPIDTSDIVILVKNSAYSFIKPLQDMFKNVKPVCVKRLKKGYKMSKIYNHLIENDRSEIKAAIFAIPKNEMPMEDLLISYSLIPEIYISINDHIDEYYIELMDNDMSNLLNKLYILEFMPQMFFSSFVENRDTVGVPDIDKVIIERITDKIWKLINDGSTKKKYVEVFGKQIYSFISVLSRYVSEKKFVISSNINIYYQKITKDGNEYNLTPILYSRKGIENVNIGNDWRRYPMNISGCSISGVGKLLPVENYFNTNATRIIFYDYHRSILDFILGGSNRNFGDILMSRRKGKMIKPEKNIKGLKLSNKVINIVSEYNFIFICIKTGNTKKNDLPLFGENMLFNLRTYGLVYTWLSKYIEEDTSGLITFCTIGKYENFKEICNRVLTNLSSYSYQITYNIIISRAGLQNDFRELVLSSSVSLG